MTSVSRIAVLFCLTALIAGTSFAQSSLTVGANVNMVTGADFPNGDPFQRQQNEPSVAFSSRNSLHLLAGANDYRAVDVPGLPGGRETGDSWLSYFWSTNGGASWKSTLIPGYPQDPACLEANPPVLCDYAAGADPVVRAGVNGMFYYSGIVFERSDPSRSAIFVSRFIDLNNDEGGDPIRHIDTRIIDLNNDGSVFLDKSWIGVDIPRGGNPGKTFEDVIQRDGTLVDQTVGCGNIYVGYAAIEGEGDNLRSEIRMATSATCGDNWDIQVISAPDTLNQGANIAIHPLTGEVHVVWRRFDTVESFLGISPTGCPASPSSWEINNDWPVSEVKLGNDTFTIELAQELLGKKHRGDESIKLAYEVIAAKLNLLTGGGDPVDGFNPWHWQQDLSGLVAEADAWFADHPVGSDPKQADKKAGQNIKKNIQEILLGSGTCTEGGGATVESTTGEPNAIIYASSSNFGETFSDPVVIDEATTFDQGSTRFSFRTTAYPTVAADADGRIYVAWAARGFATTRNDVSDGDARIVISTSTNGTVWSNPYAIDEHGSEGHQIKPSLLFAGGQLTLVYYDFRQDVSGIYEGFVIDLPQPDRLRHTVDVRVATALLPADDPEKPEFTDYSLIMDGSEEFVKKPSNPASRYIFITTDSSIVEKVADTVQAEYMVPNFPMFADGTTPFIGDYVDVAAPNLINDGGTWRFASNPGEVQVWQAVWSDNRDVRPPPDGDWSKYVAPIEEIQISKFDPTVTIPKCEDVNFPDAPAGFREGAFYTGTRNQNVYSASISNGVIVAAPGNNRPLDSGLQRGFVVYVQNTTGHTRVFRLSIPATLSGIEASFAPNDAVTLKVIEIPPYSSAVATVFAAAPGGAPASETIPVTVEEIGGTLKGSVLLNSDSAAPDPLVDPAKASLLATEVHNPAILNPAILNPAILNPAILNPAILNPAILNPAILNPAVFNPAILNPAILNPAVFNPAVLNPAILNPAILNPAILNPAIFNPAILNPAILNPAIMNPAILNPAVLNPAVLNPAILNPAILNPAILNPTVSDTPLEPGQDEYQQVDVTFTVRNNGNATTAYDLNLAAPQLAGLDYELMVYRLNETPVTQGCALNTEAQQQLVFNQSDPLNNSVDGSFYLEPGQEVYVTFRVLPDTSAAIPANPVTTFVSDDLRGLVSAQPSNTDEDPLSPPADQFGQPVVIVPGTAGGSGGTPPVNAGPLVAGQQVSVTATGYVRRGNSTSFPLLDTPDGRGSCDASCLLESAPGLSLVARIGGGPWQFVGAGPTLLTATIAGDLEFAVNDNNFNDNTGAFYATVTPAASCDIAGDWSGTFVQNTATNPTSYPLVVTDLSCATPGNVIAEVEYSSFPCSGTWTLNSIVGDTLKVTETIPSGCGSNWTYDVTLDGGALSGISTNNDGIFTLYPTITSNFVTDADGWTIANDGLPAWSETDGNPAGNFRATDESNGEYWYFKAPAQYLGNRSAVYGGELRYQLQRITGDGNFNNQPSVVLVGAGLTLVYEPQASPGLAWTSYAIPLNAADDQWHIADDECWTFVYNSPDVCTLTGAAPTPAQFESVLGSLDTLLIRGEYTFGGDSAALDNVELATPRQLVSLWSAEGNADDSVGDNDGTLQGGLSNATYAAGLIGQAFSFNSAQDQYVKVDDDPSLQMYRAMTMAAWIYPTSSGVGLHPIIVNKEGEYEMSRDADGSIDWAFDGPGPGNPGPWIWRDGAPAGSAPLNTWTHVAVTYNNGTVTTYVNGVVTGVNGAFVSGSPLPPLPAPILDFAPGQNELHIGGRQAFPSTEYFDGLIDEVAIYNYALTPSEVFDLANSGAPPLS